MPTAATHSCWTETCCLKINEWGIMLHETVHLRLFCINVWFCHGTSAAPGGRSLDCCCCLCWVIVMPNSFPAGPVLPVCPCLLVLVVNMLGINDVEHFRPIPLSVPYNMKTGLCVVSPSTPRSSAPLWVTWCFTVVDLWFFINKRGISSSVIPWVWSHYKPSVSTAVQIYLRSVK